MSGLLALQILNQVGLNERTSPALCFPARLKPAAERLPTRYAHGAFPECQRNTQHQPKCYPHAGFNRFAQCYPHADDFRDANADA